MTTVSRQTLSQIHPQPRPQRPRLLDRQGWSTLAAGVLLLLISFITNYGNGNISRFRGLPAHDQVGVCLHLAALATLNWRPVYDIEQRTKQLRIEALESEKRAKQLESRMDALLHNADSSLQTPPATGSN